MATVEEKLKLFDVDVENKTATTDSRILVEGTLPNIDLMIEDGGTGGALNIFDKSTNHLVGTLSYSASSKALILGLSSEVSGASQNQLVLEHNGAIDLPWCTPDKVTKDTHLVPQLFVTEITNAQELRLNSHDGSIAANFNMAQVANDRAKVHIKPLQSSPNDVSVNVTQGSTQAVIELDKKELDVYHNGGWINLFSEEKIKEWIANSTHFIGTLDEAKLPTFAALEGSMTITDVGHYMVWNGTEGYEILVGDLNDNLTGNIMSIGDWIIIENTGDDINPVLALAHIHADNLSKERADNLYNIAKVWVNGNYEKGSLVNHLGAIYSANAEIIPTDVSPNTANSKWTIVNIAGSTRRDYQEYVIPYPVAIGSNGDYQLFVSGIPVTATGHYEISIETNISEGNYLVFDLFITSETCRLSPKFVRKGTNYAYDRIGAYIFDDGIRICGIMHRSTSQQIKVTISSPENDIIGMNLETFSTGGIVGGAYNQDFGTFNCTKDMFMPSPYERVVHPTGSATNGWTFIESYKWYDGKLEYYMQTNELTATEASGNNYYGYGIERTYEIPFITVPTVVMSAFDTAAGLVLAEQEGSYSDAKIKIKPTIVGSIDNAKGRISIYAHGRWR